MVKVHEAHTRLYKNVFICKNCKAKIKADPRKILEGKIKCRKCKKREFRTVKKK